MTVSELQQQTTSTSEQLNEQELQQVAGFLDQDQRSHLWNNKDSLTEFLTLLNHLKEDGHLVIQPSVIQTAFFLAAGGQE